MKKFKQSFWNWKHLVTVAGISSLFLGCVFFVFPDDSVLNALAPEFVSIGITILIVDRIVERQQETARKKELILNMGGKSNDFAVTAVRALRKEGWLFDGSLQSEDFGWAELHRADLSRAEMTGAVFRSAELQKINLAGAVLQDAILTGANLEDANLALANLTKAEISIAQLQSANSLIGTVMPDGTKLRDLGEEITGVDWEREPYPDGPTFEEWVTAQESRS